MKDEDHEHCWHMGSDMDSGCYRSDGSGFTITNFICCHCGITHQERREWGPSIPLKDEKKHGEHTWLKAKNAFEAMLRA